MLEPSNLLFQAPANLFNLLSLAFEHFLTLICSTFGVPHPHPQLPAPPPSSTQELRFSRQVEFLSSFEKFSVELSESISALSAGIVLKKDGRKGGWRWVFMEVGAAGVQGVLCEILKPVPNCTELGTCRI